MNNYLLVVPFDRPGGAERVMKLVALHLAKSQKVNILIMKRKKYGFWKEFEHLSCVEYLNATKERYAYIKFYQWLKKEKREFDYVFTSHLHMNALVAISRRLKLLSVGYHVARESTNVLERFTGKKLFIYKLTYKQGYRKIDRHIFQTREMKNSLLKTLMKCFEGEYKIVPNPLALSELQQMAKEVTDIPPRSIVAVGTLTENKGQNILIEILRELDKDVHLVLLGDGSDRGKLENLATNIGVRDRVVFKGMVSNVAKYCKAATLCVHASWQEGFPNSLLEMMAVNTRIASTISTESVATIPGILKSHPGDKKTLTNNITQLLAEEHEYDMYNRIVLDRYLQNHSIERFVDEIFS